MRTFLRVFYRFSSAYWTGRAARRGTLPRRMARRAAYRASGRLIRRLFR
ncbi:MAG TPA: hypothetical protein VKX16_16005 [Chloroflexota bacterium]|nr:hypothetical protein [Chloroflexota bacterium]